MELAVSPQPHLPGHALPRAQRGTFLLSQPWQQARRSLVLHPGWECAHGALRHSSMWWDALLILMLIKQQMKTRESFTVLHWITLVNYVYLIHTVMHIILFTFYYFIIKKTLKNNNNALHSHFKCDENNKCDKVIRAKIFYIFFVTNYFIGLPKVQIFLHKIWLKCKIALIW